MKLVKSNKALQTTLWLIAILLVWEITARTGVVSSYFLPPFSIVAQTMFTQLFTGDLGIQSLNSIFIILCGFAISIVLVIIIAVLCAWSPVLDSFFSALCTVFNPLPGIAILPLIIMWFGISTGAMLALVTHGVLWPMITSMLTGFKAVPKIYSEWGENIGLNPIRRVTDIYLFCVMPYVIDGLRVGWGRAWRALISAEMLFGMIGTLGGLGYYIFTNRAFANMRNVMAGVLVIIIIGMIVEVLLFKALEKHTLLKWGMSNG